MRNRSGWLTVDRLKAGDREQYAVTRLGATHIVTLGHRAMPGPLHFVVSHTVQSPTFDTTETHQWFFATVDDARRLFRARVRKHTSG